MFVLYLGLISGEVAAITPPPSPSDLVVCSENIRFCAYQSYAEAGRISVFKVPAEKFETARPMYSIENWPFQIFVSNDGETVVGLLGTVFLKTTGRDTIFMRVWRRGVLVKSISLSEIIGSRKLRSISKSEFLLGYPKGFEGDSKFVFETSDGSVSQVSLR